MVVDKDSAPHEHLPPAWQVCGTTGYDFANLVSGLFVDAASAEAMERIWRNFSERRQAFDEILYQAKRTIMQNSLASELNMLANQLVRIAEMDRHTRDYPLRRPVDYERCAKLLAQLRQAAAGDPAGLADYVAGL